MPNPNLQSKIANSFNQVRKTRKTNLKITLLSETPTVPNVTRIADQQNKGNRRGKCGKVRGEQNRNEEPKRRTEKSLPQATNKNELHLY